MKFSSFDIFDAVLKEADRRFAPRFRIVPERVEILKEYCSAFDRMIDESDGEEFECSVDENDMTVKFSVVLYEITVDKPDSPFRPLAKRAMSIDMEPAGYDTMKLTMVFPSLWENA